MMIATSDRFDPSPTKQTTTRTIRAKQSARSAYAAPLPRKPGSIPGAPGPRVSSDRFHLSVTGTFVVLCLLLHPLLVFAQASPFQTGATALQTNLLTIMTPIAIILVIALGVAAMVNRISWGWCAAAVVGIAIAFGAPQMVTWVRGMFGV